VDREIYKVEARSLEVKVKLDAAESELDKLKKDDNLRGLSFMRLLWPSEPISTLEKKINKLKKERRYHLALSVSPVACARAAADAAAAKMTRAANASGLCRSSRGSSWQVRAVALTGLRARERLFHAPNANAAIP
jgi:hypothetical protein